MYGGGHRVFPDRTSRTALACFCFLVTPINQFLIILGRCTLYTPVCLQDEPTCMRIEPVKGSLICTGDDCPCTRGLQLTSRTEGPGLDSRLLRSRIALLNINA